MDALKIYGGKPLTGEVKTSGARNCASKVIFAAVYSSEDIVLKNVPRTGNIAANLEILESIGAYIEWVGQKTLRINGSGINSFKIPFELGSSQLTTLLLAGPLVHKFGEAHIPKPMNTKFGARPINRFLKTWECLDYEVAEDDKYIYLKAQNLEGSNVSFKINTHLGTENAIISSLFAKGDTFIKNAAEEIEVDALIEFCNCIGAHVERIEPRIIKVTGTERFKGCDFTVPPDKTDAVTFATAALMTHGNIIIHDVVQSHLLSFTNVLTKMGAKYEFHGNQMRVWNTENIFEPAKVVTAPAPGFLTEWLPFITVLLTRAKGKSIVYDTVYTNRFGYIKDLNMMGAHIKLLRPSEAGFETVISDDGYNIRREGEPFTVADIEGPVRLKSSKLILSEMFSGLALLIAALSADGKSEITGFSNIEEGFEGFVDRFLSLGAQIDV